MLYIVEIPHRFKSFAWRTESRETYCAMIMDLNRTGETIYEESTLLELAKMYGVDLADSDSYDSLTRSLFGDPYRGDIFPEQKIYKCFGEEHWTPEPVASLFECCAAFEASDLSNYFVFEDADEALEGLRSLTGHNVTQAMQDLTDLLADDGYLVGEDV